MFSRFVGMSTLFGISIQHFIFFNSSSFQSSIPSFHFTSQNLMRTLFIFFFLTLFLFFFSLSFSFFFFLLWILAQTTTLKQTDQISSWNTMDKGFKKERLLKGSMGWLAIMYQERKRKTHIWLKVDKNCLISSLKD